MSDPSVNRKLFFELDEEYTEDDLEQDLRKTQVLPFTQLGTPSPYRAPVKTRVIRVVKSSAPLEIPTSITPLAIVKPLNFKSNSNPSISTQLPEGLKTPTTHVTEWSKPKPLAGVLPAPNFAPPAPKQELQQQAPTQNSSVKIVPSKYMQQPTKPEPTPKSIKKSASGTSRNPLSQVDVNNNTMQDPEKRRMTIAASKKAASKPVQLTSSRPSVGPTMSSHQTTNKTSVASTTNASQNASSESKVATSGTIATSATQSDLRAALLQRKEQKAAALAEQKAAKQAAAAKPVARPSLGHSSSSVALTRSSHVQPTHPAPTQTPQAESRRNTLTRQQSACLESASKTRTSSNETHANAKVVASRYMNMKTVSKAVAEELPDDGNSEIAAPTPTRTPGSLKRSFSTSSIKKMPSAKKTTVASQASQAEAAKKEANAQQLANMSARVTSAISSSGQHLASSGSVSSLPQKKEPVNLQTLQMDTQLMQSQLLQWHVINRRLEQSRVAKRTTGSHMILAVLNKIEAMRRASDDAEAELNARQASVYQAELEQFKVSCIQPRLQQVERFLHTYTDTATQLERDTHKMPMIGIAPVEPRSLMAVLKESHEILSSMQSECLEQFKEWDKTGAAAKTLARTVQEEVHEIKSYTEVLHALTTLGNQEASLIIHKHHLQEETSKQV